jgi:Rad3-related DNA helicase
MPYNFLMSPKIRKTFELELSNSIIIIDEAHNISSCAEGIMEIELTEDDLRNMTKELD